LSFIRVLWNADIPHFPCLFRH